MKIDSISLGFTMAAALIAMYLYYNPAIDKTLMASPILLLTLSAATNFYISFRYAPDYSTSSAEAGQILLYTALGVAGLYVANIGSSLATAYVGLSAIDALSLSVLQAITETLFFQGAVLNYLRVWGRLGDYGAVAGSAATFYIYHLWVYGENPSALLYVFSAGLILGFITIKTGRLTSAMICHVLNNLMAVMR